MLPLESMKNVDSIFRKAIPNSRYLDLCSYGWGKASSGMPQALGLQGLVVGADGWGQACLCSPGEPYCNRLGSAKYQGLRKVAELWLRDCHIGAWGHLAEGQEWVNTILIRPTIIQSCLAQGDPEVTVPFAEQQQHKRCQHASFCLPSSDQFC